MKRWLNAQALTSVNDMKPHATIAYDALPELSDAERISRATAFFETLKTRRTCRMFSNEPVPPEVIKTALLAAGQLRAVPIISRGILR